MRITGYVLIGVAAALLLVVAAFFILTRTEFGLERVSEFVVARFEEQIEGELRVGRVTTDDLLGGATVHNLVIDGPFGRTFLRVDSVRVSYDWRSLFGDRFVFDEAVVYDARVNITRLPGDSLWNYEYIFPDRTPYTETPDPYIAFEDARVRSGQVVVRYPWDPEEGEPVEVSDTARLILEPAPGGLLRVLRFERADAELSRVLWSSPAEEAKLFEVEALSTLGYIYEQPFQLRDLTGTISVSDSIVSYDAGEVRLPSSVASSIGRIIIGEDVVSYDLRIEGEDVAFRDLQWLYPRFPDEGGGNLRLRVNTLAPDRTLWLATDAHLRAPGTEVMGTLGVVTGDTLYFTRVNLRASPLNLALIEQVTPGELPLEGLLVGTVEVQGPLSALETRGNVRLSTAPGSEAEVRWTGVLDARSGWPRRLDARIQALDAALVKRLWSRIGNDGNAADDVSGKLSGRIRLTDGGADAPFRFSGRIHQLADAETGAPASELAIQGLLRRAPASAEPPRIEATLRAEPVAMNALAAWWGGAGRIEGLVRGTVRVRGPVDDLNVQADLETRGGSVSVAGRIGLSGSRPEYRLDADFRGLELHSLVGSTTEAVVSGRVTLDGVGLSPDGMRTTIGVILDSARLDRLAVTSGTAAFELRDGTLSVDTFRFDSPAGQLTARGSFGVDSAAAGTLEVALDLRSLTNVLPLVAPWIPSTVAADSLLNPAAGALFESGTDSRVTVNAAIEGRIGSYSVIAELEAPGAVYGNMAARGLSVRFTGRDPGSGGATYRGWIEADTLDLGSYLLAAVRADGAYGPTGGHISVRASGPNSVRYGVAATIRRGGDTSVMRVSEFEAGRPEGAWTLAGPASVRFTGNGLALRDLVLTHPNGGRITAAGRLPWTPHGETDATARPVGFSLRLDSVRIGPILRIGQFESELRGTVDAYLTADGRAGAPRFAGEASVTAFRRADLHLRRAELEFAYDQRRLDARVELWGENRRILLGRGRIPVDLALVPVENRRLSASLEVSLDANRIPAALAASLLEGFQDVRGEIDGAIAVGGTTRDPALAGGIVLQDGAARWIPSGVNYRGVQGTFRVLNDRVVAVDVTARAGDEGTAAIGGRITFETLTDPRFDLTLRMDRLPAVVRPEIEFVATGDIQLRGRYTQPVVTGGLRVNGGALHLDELARARRVVEIGEPILLDMIDTTLVANPGFVPDETNPFLRNLVLNAAVTVGRGFWLRGSRMDVEMTGDITVAFDQKNDRLELSGELSALRGSYILHIYNIYQRRFAVREGTVEFVGAPGLNPNLDMTAGYQVRTSQGYPIDILVHVTGTLRSPRVRLTSDAEPPIGESDLLSYLVFGRPTFALAPSENRTIDRFVGLGVQTLFAPRLLDPIAGEIESAFGFDYFAITSTDLGAMRAGAGAAAPDPLWPGAQIELGQYLTPELFWALTARVAPPWSRRSAEQSVGFRFDWEFMPTWSAEFFWGDQLARYPSFGGEAILRQRKLIGLFLAREWGY